MVEVDEAGNVTSTYIHSKEKDGARIDVIVRTSQFRSLFPHWLFLMMVSISTEASKFNRHICVWVDHMSFGLSGFELPMPSRNAGNVTSANCEEGILLEDINPSFQILSIVLIHYPILSNIYIQVTQT